MDLHLLLRRCGAARQQVLRPLRRRRASSSSTSGPTWGFFGPQAADKATQGGVPAAAKSLYPTHMPTSPLQKLFIAGYSALTAVRNPERGDMVAALGETTGLIALRRLRDQMRDDPVGREILRERPSISLQSLQPEELAKLPEGSFGRAYAAFMLHHDFSADDRSPVRFVDDPELAFVIQRYRQVHDFWHVLCGLPPDVLGELALKWLEMLQTGLPVAALSALAGPLALPTEERRVLREVYIPWAVTAAPRARPLMNVWYERELDTPLSELRARLNITPAPQRGEGKGNKA